MDFGKTDELAQARFVSSYLQPPYLEILEEVNEQFVTGRGCCKSLERLDKRLELTYTV